VETGPKTHGSSFLLVMGMKAARAGGFNLGHTHTSNSLHQK
jgi:hypothetical protein